MGKCEAKLAAIGILGGTFDPIHFGHLRMAQELADAVSLDQVRLIPSGNPPHRSQPQTSAEHRAAMVKLAISDNPRFILDEREILRNGTSYTIDTLIALRESLEASTSINFMVGSDAFLNIDTWHRWEALLDYANLVVAHRPNTPPSREKMSTRLRSVLDQKISPSAETLKNQPAGLICLQDVTSLDISASKIRMLLNMQTSPKYLTPDAVIDYIKSNQLYGTAQL
ncbi:MAG: nicotinate-nucleotide adenylyltransferase [Methylophilaceae bacterium]